MKTNNTKAEIVLGYRTEAEADDAIRAYGLQGASPEFFDLFDEWNILLADGLLLTDRTATTNN